MTGVIFFVYNWYSWVTSNKGQNLNENPW